MFSLPLELVTDKGVLELRDARVGMHVLGYEDGKAVTNKIEEIEDLTQKGNFLLH